MSTTQRRLVIVGIIVLAAVVLIAGSLLIVQYFFAPRYSSSPMNGPFFGGFDGSRGFTSNGEQIYFTGASETGPPISAQMPGTGNMPGMMGGGMAGGQMACVTCHGPDGRGGTVRMMMDSFEAPDIRYSALTGEEHDEDHAEHEPYTEETIKRAITEGVDPAGQPLDWPMPRWNMTDSQLNDLIAFLKSLE